MIEIIDYTEVKPMNSSEELQKQNEERRAQLDAQIKEELDAPFDRFKDDTNYYKVVRRKVFCAIVGSELIRMHPDGNPHELNKILQHIKDYFVKNGYFDSFMDDYVVPFKRINGNFIAMIESILMECPAFRIQNLTEEEYIHEVDPDSDERSLQMRFVTMYDYHEEDSWKTDFIDLDAAIQNIATELELYKIEEKDCAFCIRNKQFNELHKESNEEPCNKCVRNHSLYDMQDFFETEPYIKGKNQTFCGGQDCPSGRYTCCTECTKECRYRCPESANHKDASDMNQVCEKAIFWAGLKISK